MGFQYREFFGFGARENTARVLVRGMSDTRVLPTRPAANDSSDHHRGSIPARARTARGAAGARKSLCRIQHKVCATRPARLIATMRAALKRVHPRRSSGIYPSRGSPRSGTALLRLSRTECFPLFSPSGFFFLTVHSSGEQQQISDEPVALHKRQLARLSDPELQRSYLYLRWRWTKASHHQHRRCSISSSGANCGGAAAPRSADSRNIGARFAYA